MGNVWEWVESPWSNSNYSARSSRGVRGGSCLYYSYGMKASYRYGYLVGISPILELYHLGFRVASILEPVIGDLNDDGIVGSRDLDLVRGWWLMEVEPGRLDRGDATGDGIVDSADLDIVRGNWGAGLAAVPEPTVGSLFACGFLTWTATRRRRRRRATVADVAEFFRR